MPSSERYACAQCGEKFPREFTHRNRAGAYICLSCRAVQRGAGFLERGATRLKLAAYRVGKPVLFTVGLLLLALVVAYLIIAVAV